MSDIYKAVRDHLINELRLQGIQNESVLQALTKVPRHLFIDEKWLPNAYRNAPLPLHHGQTISQPYIVAKMTELLFDHDPIKNVLEIGTGCGYQAAVLSVLVDKVFSVERIKILCDEATTRLTKLGFDNVLVKCGDGYEGWQEHAPFDGIIVTAAPTEVPDVLLSQLAMNGRLVIPFGEHDGQILTVIQRTPNGFVSTDIELVAFVPMLKGTD